MLSIVVPEREYYDERTNKFYQIKSKTLQLEHSLVSISKWEAKWKKPFLRKEPMTNEEFIDYIRCMTLTQNVDPMVYIGLSQRNYDDITEYIKDPMTATWFGEDDNKKNSRSREVITAEVIYYWMIALNIPFECRKWHFNRLMTLIKVCNIKNQPPKKMNKRDILNRNHALNEARKKKFHTSG